MAHANSTSRKFDSALSRAALKNLSGLLDLRFPQFEIFYNFEYALRVAEHTQKQATGLAGKTPLPAVKQILAAVVGVERYDEIPSLLIAVDEDLTPSQLSTSRVTQAQRLNAYLQQKSEILGLALPDNLLSACKDLIEVWQPTMCAPDGYPKALKRAMTAKTAGELPAWLNRVGPKLEDASASDAPPPPKSVIFDALALLAVADPDSLTQEIWNSYGWAVMRENLGLVAVKMANTRESADTIRAANILEHLFDSGILYAGVQLAQLYQLVMTSKRLDKQRAHDLIDEVYDRYQRAGGTARVFTTAASEEELYRMYNTIKVDALRHACDEHQVYRLTRELIEAALKGATARFEGFSAMVLSILIPDFEPLQGADNEEIFALREKISNFPAAEAYCQTMAKAPDAVALTKRRWIQDSSHPVATV